MSNSDFNLNRPIHLARRDVYFERAMELLGRPWQAADGVPVERVSESLALLKTAQHHAGMASQCARTSDRELDFQRFLELIVDNVASAHAMLHHRIQLEHEEGFLSRFLAATPEECALPALHYQRRAEDILHGVWHLLRLAVPAYHRLRKETTEALPEAERSRYQKALDGFRAEIAARAGSAA